MNMLRITAVCMLTTLLIIICFTIPYVLRGENAEQASNSDGTVTAVVRCLSLEEGRDICYATLCEYEPGYLCVEDIITTVTEMRGPEVGSGVLKELLESPIFGMNPNGHELGHVIGRTAAKKWGIFGDVFNRCPIDFDYGCLHGFFEIAITRADSPSEALISICENMPVGPRFNTMHCYHGGGHGIMMNESYNLYRALEVCDALPESVIGSCWGGVFMENTNGFKRGFSDGEMNTFSEDNPLAPCDSVPYKYRGECYILHADYLIEGQTTSLDRLIDICLGAGDHTKACLRGVARIFAAGRQNVILRGSNLDFGGDFVESTYSMCHMFPDEYVEMCHYLAVRQFIAPDHIQRGFQNAVTYCMREGVDRKRCYENMSSQLGDIVGEDKKVEMCVSVPEEYRDFCVN